MKKYKLIKKAGVVVLASVLVVTPVNASSLDSDKASEETLENKLFTWGKKLVDWSSKVDQKINDKVVEPASDKLSEQEVIKHDSLWLITDMPGVDPNIERHYYFVNKNMPSIKWTFYYDKNGNKVSRKSSNKAMMEVREMYVSLTDLDTVYKMESYSSYVDNTFTVNYEYLNDTFVYDSDFGDNYTYGVFEDFDFLLDENEIKEKYSLDDLVKLEEKINDLDLEIKSSDTLKLERK